MLILSKNAHLAIVLDIKMEILVKVALTDVAHVNQLLNALLVHMHIIKVDHNVYPARVHAFHVHLLLLVLVVLQDIIYKVINVFNVLKNVMEVVIIIPLMLNVYNVHLDTSILEAIA